MPWFKYCLHPAAWTILADYPPQLYKLPHSAANSAISLAFEFGTWLISRTSEGFRNQAPNRWRNYGQRSFKQVLNRLTDLFEKIFQLSRLVNISLTAGDSDPVTGLRLPSSWRVVSL